MTYDSPEWPTIQKSILSWALERLSSIMVVTSSIRSSRPSYPLKRYIEPLTSTKNHSFFLCFLLEAKCGLLLSPRCLKTDRSPLKASTNLVSSRSPEVLCLIHARSLPLLSVHTGERERERERERVSCWLLAGFESYVRRLCTMLRSWSICSATAARYDRYWSS